MLLKQIEEFLSHASKVTVGVLVINPKSGEILYSNEEVRSIFSLPALEDIKAHKLTDLCCDPPLEIYDAMRRISQGEQVYLKVDHVIACRADAKRVPVSCVLMTIEYENSPACLLIVVDRSREIHHIRLYDALSNVNRILWEKPEVAEREWLTKLADIFHTEAGFLGVVIGEVDEKDHLFHPLIVRSSDPEALKLFDSLTIKLKDGGGGGLLCPAYYKKKVVVIEDLVNDPYHASWKEYHERFGVAGGAAIPLVVNDEVKYIMVLYDTIKDAFSEHLEPFYKDLQLILSLTLKSIYLFRDKEYTRKLYTLLYHLISVSLRAKSEADFVEKLPEVFYRCLNASIVALFLVEDGKLKYQKAMALDLEHMDLVREISAQFEKYTVDTLPEILDVAKAIKTRELSFRSTLKMSQILNETPDVEELTKCNTLLISYGVKSCGALPLLKRGTPIGVVLFLSKEEDFFTLKIQELLNLSIKEIDFILTNMEAERFNKILLKALDEGFDLVTILDRNFRFVYANRPALERTGYTLEELLGKHHSIFSSKIYDKQFVRRFYKTLTSGEVFSDYMIYRLKDGSLAQGYMTIIPYKEEGKVTHYICIGKEVTRDEKFIEETVRFLFYDRVTGLPNLRRFIQELEESLEEMSSEGKSERGILVIIDPVDFELINQTYGFEVGNKVLKEIGRRIRETLYKTDLVGRMESDAFSIFIKNVPSLEAGIFVIESLLDILDKPFTNIKSATPIHLAFRAGAAVYPSDGRDPSKLIDAAKVALMEARRKDERLVFYSEEMTRRARFAVILNNEIREGLEKGEFTFFYQPVVDGEGKIRGAECLLRWIKDGKTITPGEFFPIIRQHTMIQLEEYLAELFVSKVRELKQILERKNLCLSFNISPEALSKSKISDHLLREIASSPEIGRHIVIEFIERSFLEAEEKVLNFLHAIRRYGVKIAVDDFGSGYSSITYLAQLPVDILKLDMCLTREILTSERIRSVVESIIYLSKKIGLITIAEGIEDVNQYKMVKGMGCHLFQGFLFYKPLSEEDLVKLLR